MAKTIRVSINEDVERVLDVMKGDYPTLDHAEILKLGLSELYRQRELRTRQAWIDSLPTLDISKEEAQEIDEARAEIKASGREPMTAEELISSLADA